MSASWSRRAWLWPLLLALGLGLRLLALPAWGTFDVEIWKGWSGYTATHSVADIYGPSDAELRARAAPWYAPQWHRTLEWRGGTFVVDYPPGSVLVQWAAGRLYRWLSPGLDDERLFNAVVNLAPLMGSIAIALLLWRSSAEHGRTRALVFWLNPAALLAAPLLGYQDMVFCAIALLAILALRRERWALAASAVTLAGLVKPQGALLVPALLLLAARDAPWRAWLASAAAGLGTVAAVFAPWWSSGYLFSALDGCLRPLSQPALAPLGLNVWWIAGWLRQWQTEGPWPLAQIVSISDFAAWAGFDPRLIARVLLLAATLAIMVWLWRRPRDDRRALPIAVILQVHAYALFGTSVHENHTLLAIVLAPLLIGEWSEARRLNAATSTFTFLNLFLMAGGLGRRLMRLRTLVALRQVTVLDLSVIVAVGHVALVAWLALAAARLDRRATDH
jgi:hypothetical protein